MKHRPRHPITSRAAALLAVLSLVGACAPSKAAPEPPPPPSPPPSPQAVRPPSDADLDAQLEAARKRLDEAAHEVARLSTQMSGAIIDEVAPHLGTGRAIIGVQLEPAAAGAGARVRAVSPGGPAAEAGIRAGDVIVAVNGTELKEKDDSPSRQVVRILRDVEPETKVTVRVLRDGKTRDFTVMTRPGPGPLAMVRRLPDVTFGPFPDMEGWMIHGPLMDMELATLTPHLGSYFGSDKGVLVLRAPSDGALKLEDGDVILAIDGRQPTSGSHATRILASYQPGEKLTLRILRQHKTLELEATVPEQGGHDKIFRHRAIHEHFGPEYFERERHVGPERIAPPPPGPVVLMRHDEV